ncbi:Serine/threonine-protein kinase RAD53 [Colletotrichum fructicola]|nr:Serine/threonine-protein kinase RAD53 [Colletotrichum fructicola]
MNPLRAQLRTAQIPQETAFTGSFVPYSSLKELISKQVVKDTLTKRKQKPRTDISTLVSFVCGKPEARRIFAILVWIGQVGLIDTVYAHNFVDSLLPLYIDHNGTVKTHTTGSGASEIVTKVFSDERWTEESPDFFCEAQWQFLGPIFREQQFKYSFLKQHRMPFLKQPSTSNHRESYFSTVEKWCIHKAHFKKSSKIPISLDRNGHPLVAVKSLKSVNMNDQEYRDAAETEADVLEMIRDLEHPHLIKAIAYYTRDDQYYIVFPWAGGGNLRDYWGGEPPRELDAEYIGWVVGQLCGLAGAMERLHSSSKGTCRHGDLKPENILCFEDRGRADPFAQPFLVIADVGLAKVHTLATEMRNEATRTKNGTVMYEPPEAILQLEKNQPRSRRYDTWSMGCIYFEFLIWVLYGKSELVRFGEDITHRENRSRQFFEVVGSGAVGAAKIKPSVQKWVDWMRKDPRCPRNTAVREILELICTRLLVIE